jgi:hypothetical protein
VSHSSSFLWAVIGAGPAGIAAVGQLLDKKISPEHIIWIDPDFNVGDFGSKWCKVSSNTSVKLFNRFYNHCSSFDYPSVADHFEITGFDESATCLLEYAAQPLRWITQSLTQRVPSVFKKVEHLELKNHHWHITLNNNKMLPDVLQAKNIILAIGSDPKSLQFEYLDEIPLIAALDPEMLSLACHADDVIAVFGSSHSAIIILKNLLEQTNVRQVINLYQNPLRYAVYFDDWVLFDDTGLKGNTAKWAREYLHGTLPDKLMRIISTAESIKEFLPKCTKAIYPIGFNRRLMTVNGMSSFQYNEHNGIIAPGLFGLGIGFPEAAIDRYGMLEYRVGIWKFMDYVTRVLPVWLKYSV